MKAAPKRSAADSRKPARKGGKKDAPRSNAIVPPVAAAKETTGQNWTFLTNHSHVLVLLARNPTIVLREVALQVGITERAVQRIIADLEAGEIIEREKIGRRNQYSIRTDQCLRHPIESHRTIGELLVLLNTADE